MCAQLAAGFVERGWEVVFLTAASPPNPRREALNGYTVIRKGGRLSVYPWALLWLFAHRSRVGAVIDSENGIPFFSPVVLRRKTPVVLLFHHVHLDQFSEYFSRCGAMAARFLEGPVTRLVYGDRVVACVSPSTRRDVRLRLRLKGRAIVVPNGAPAPRSTGLSAGRSPTPRVVCVGRFAPHKRTALVVATVAGAVKRYPDLELHLVGNGPERESVCQTIIELGVGANVFVHGSLPACERDALMESAWLTVSASQREGWGLSILEANALGVPALGLRRPGLRDSIRHGETGWLVDEEGELEVALCSALARLSDERFASQMAEQCRAWVRAFPSSRMVESLVAIVEDESRRLASLGKERRVLTDLATVVNVPVALLPASWSHRAVRSTDQVDVTPEHVTFLLYGSDSDSIRPVVERLGINLHPHGQGAEEAVTSRLARPTDLLAVRRLAPGPDLVDIGHTERPAGNNAVTLKAVPKVGGQRPSRPPKSQKPVRVLKGPRRGRMVGSP